MRNLAKIAAVLLVVLGLGACMGKDGQPYLMFTWDAGPPDHHFFTDALPAGVYSGGVYYEVDAGEYYAEFQYVGFSVFGIDFVITANEGEFLEDGEDSHFELWMDPAGWVYWQWDSVAGHQPPGDPKTGQPAGVKAADKPVDKSGLEWKALGSFEQVRGRYKMTGTYGVYVPKQ